MYETGKNSWVGKLVRKNNIQGQVISDWNWQTRRLTVLMLDGTTQTIEMNNVGDDDPSVHDWEWYEESRKRWYRF